MFDFLQLMSFGSEVEYNNEKWISVHQLSNRCHLVVKPDAPMPCQVYLIQLPETKENGDNT